MKPRIFTLLIVVLLSTLLNWTGGQLNEGNQLRIMIQTPAQRPTTASIVGLGITKL